MKNAAALVLWLFVHGRKLQKIRWWLRVPLVLDLEGFCWDLPGGLLIAAELFMRVFTGF